MRIISGEFGGRRLDSPDAATTRPTTDRVRESLFSSLFSRTAGFSGLAVLDAFAGSGALGIEALSRGAASASFWERDAAAARILVGNLVALGLSAPHARVHVADVFGAAASGALAADGPFDLVLLDPPYATPAADVVSLAGSLCRAGALADGAVVSYEHAASDDVVSLCADALRDAGLAADGTRAYGTIAVTYLRPVTPARD